MEMPSWGVEDEDEMYHRVASTSISAQKAADEMKSPDTPAYAPYKRYENQQFSAYQFAHSALKNQAIGVVNSWKAAIAYNQMEKDHRDALLEKIKREDAAAAEKQVKQDSA